MPPQVGLLGHVDKVGAGWGQGEAGADGETFDRGNDRLVEFPEL
jgi:hypothetical protein